MRLKVNVVKKIQLKLQEFYSRPKLRSATAKVHVFMLNQESITTIYNPVDRQDGSRITGSVAAWQADRQTDAVFTASKTCRVVSYRGQITVLLL